MITKRRHHYNYLDNYLDQTVRASAAASCLPINLKKLASRVVQIVAGMDQEPNAFARTRDRPTNPAAADINNAPSLGQLHDQPIGLAYITSGFEINGPIRFKRSVSGNRYKAPGNNQATGWLNPPQGYGNGPDPSSRDPNYAAPSPGKVLIVLPLLSSLCGNASIARV